MIGNLDTIGRIHGVNVLYIESYQLRLYNVKNKQKVGREFVKNWVERSKTSYDIYGERKVNNYMEEITEMVIVHSS